MANYVLSNNNRYYAALESNYGQVPAISAANRIAGIRLSMATQKIVPVRRDKTGTRTFLGIPGSPRKAAAFELETSLMAGATGVPTPAIGQLIQAALGGSPQVSAAQTATCVAGQALLTFQSPHGLSAGSAIVSGSEMRFVQSVPSNTSVQLCAPLSVAGAVVVLPAASYSPASTLPSLTLFDYWDPSTTIQRLARGAGVDQMEIQIDGTEHKLIFRGPAAEDVDSSSFNGASGGLTQFPVEPAVQAQSWAPVPGQLGQAWIGSGPSEVLTLTKAQIVVKNNLMTRSFEFGSNQPLALSAGDREVDIQFEVYSTDDSVFGEMYHASQTETPIPLTIQLGEQPGAMAAIYVKSFVPQVPDYDDSETRLLWSFRNSRAQGTGDDEIFFAFG
jgi:hypothetical protein